MKPDNKLINKFFIIVSFVTAIVVFLYLPVGYKWLSIIQPIIQALPVLASYAKNKNMN